mmetsp:Transcript_17736/g.32690  ORF Transcript_17736/g.32690 Transcript_17736/m.32690 type:complete len:254 (-) Transcript_17736:278-1039(-)
MKGWVGAVAAAAAAAAASGDAVPWDGYRAMVPFEEEFSEQVQTCLGECLGKAGMEQNRALRSKPCELPGSRSASYFWTSSFPFDAKTLYDTVPGYTLNAAFVEACDNDSFSRVYASAPFEQYQHCVSVCLNKDTAAENKASMETLNKNMEVKLDSVYIQLATVNKKLEDLSSVLEAVLQRNKDLEQLVGSNSTLPPVQQESDSTLALGAVLAICGVLALAAGGAFYVKAKADLEIQAKEAEEAAIEPRVRAWS